MLFVEIDKYYFYALQLIYSILYVNLKYDLSMLLVNQYYIYSSKTLNLWC